MSTVVWNGLDMYAHSIHGGTYFLQDQTTKLIKIGHTRNFRNRFRDVSTGLPGKLTVLALHPSEDMEKEFHIKFASDREAGEWFRPSPQLLQFTEDICFDPAIFCDVCGSVMWKEEEEWRIKDARESFCEFLNTPPHVSVGRDRLIFCSSDCCQLRCSKC